MIETLYIKGKYGSYCGTCGEKIDYHHGKMVSCEIKWVQALKSKEEAVAFAKKYLEDRKRKGTDETNLDDPYWTWKIATEYVLLDIIPHLYGEALD